MSSSSPTRSRASSTSSSPMRPRKASVPAGFRPPPKPKQRPLEELTIRELQDLHARNANILATPAPSTSSYIPRISAEQAAIEARLVELEGMDIIQNGLKSTRIVGEDDMSVDPEPEPPVSRTLEAKRKALARFAPPNPSNGTGVLTFQEAVEIEQRAHLRDKERQQRALEKRMKTGLPIKGETRQEREARIWAFMNHKPTESDLEDDSDDDSDDDDPATWFEDDQDDGRKGQDIIEPDAEDLADIIRMDTSKLHYSTFYEPRDEGD